VTKNKITAEEAFAFHFEPIPGKFEITATVPMTTQRDLSLAYSPGVAVPCAAIVAVISNGTAVLGLGNLGALASKPVLEGKAVLFKRFADVNSIDIELDTEDTEACIDAVRLMGRTFGGINLEDIKAPECFIIEQRLNEEMDIPVFHDDQHGTAVICAAGLLNALKLSGKKIEDVRIVLNWAGAAGIACLELLKAMGARHNNCIMCDTKGVIYQGRIEGMNQWKSAHAASTDMRTLAQAMVGADVFLGVSAKGAVTADMVAGMAPDPVIFAMANPDPEITPEEAHAMRPDAIVATGRSDYPNQVNNVLGFPYLFRGALDINARAINDEMKIVCAHALANLAREDVPDEVALAYGKNLTFGRDYIIPTPFDPRLIHTIPPAVARAGMQTGVAWRPIIDMDAYEQVLKSRLDPTANIMRGINMRAQANQACMIFTEGDDPKVLRAAVMYQRQGFGEALVVGRADDVFDADAKGGAAGITALLHKGRIVLIDDTLVHEWPDANDPANIAQRAARVARHLGLEPRVAFVSFSTFGYPVSERAEKMHLAPEILNQRGVDFEYEDEMTVDVALNVAIQKNYPFSRLTGPANILVVPARHSASISVKLMQEMAGATVIGPILTGLDQSIQIASSTSTTNDILNMAILAACKVGG
jgi:malate dehydrogenase (oxaloacetate-decarboxylating)(NADP+)